MRLTLPTLFMAGLMSSLLALPAFAQVDPAMPQHQQHQQPYQQQQVQPVQGQTWSQTSGTMQTNRWADVEMTRVQADMLTRYERAAARGLPAGVSCPSQIEGVYVTTMDTPNGITLTMTGPERYQDHIRNWLRNEGQIFLKYQAMAPSWSNQPVYYPVGATLPGEQVGQTTTLDNGCMVSWRRGVNLGTATLAAADEGCQVIMPANLDIPPAADLQVMDIDNGAQLTFTARDAAHIAQLRQHLRQNAQLLNQDRCTNLFTTSAEVF